MKFWEIRTYRVLIYQIRQIDKNCHRCRTNAMQKRSVVYFATLGLSLVDFRVVRLPEGHPSMVLDLKQSDDL